MWIKAIVAGSVMGCIGLVLSLLLRVATIQLLHGYPQAYVPARYLPTQPFNASKFFIALCINGLPFCCMLFFLIRTRNNLQPTDFSSLWALRGLALGYAFPWLVFWVFGFFI
ncbi:MAG: hypothetical protein JO316_25515 [Abitibacteriaceae bacterium]|nr:hypothetical protein [Abditibacteriaceae bacterium]